MPIGFFTKRQSTVYPLSSITGSSNPNYDAGQERETAGGLTYSQMYNMYKYNVWVRACVDRIKTRVVDIKPKVKAIFKVNETKSISSKTRARMDKIENLLDNPNKEKESFESLRKKYLTDLLIYDAAALELLKETVPNEVNGFNVSEIFSLPGYQIRHNVGNKGYKDLTNAYYQVDDDNHKGAYWGINDLMYFMLNPQSSNYYGLSPLESLNQTVTAELYSSQHNLDFFANDATPRIAITFDNLGIGQSQAAMKRVKDWWNRELQGKPHSPIIMGTDSGTVKITPVKIPNRDMEFQAYSEWLLMKIMAVYYMQPFILGIIMGTTGKLNSEQQAEQFNIDAVRPQLNLFDSQWNREIIWSPAAFNYDDVYIGWDFDTRDQDKIARTNEIYLRSGQVTINEVRRQAGADPVPWGDVPYMQNNVSPFGVGQGLEPGTYKPIGTKPTGKVPTGLENLPQGQQKSLYWKALEEKRKALDIFIMEINGLKK